jgi:hypothetical protein
VVEEGTNAFSFLFFLHSDSSFLILLEKLTHAGKAAEE